MQIFSRKQMLILTGILCAGLMTVQTRAQVVCLEDLNFPDSLAHPISDIGWTLVRNDGTSLTDGNSAITVATDVEGTHRIWNNAGGVCWWVTDAPILSSITQVRWLDRNASRYYRLGLEVGGTWYLSPELSTSLGGGFDPGDGAGHPGITITDFSTFTNWTTAPPDDATPWSVTLGGSALPAGDITRIGLMNISTDPRFDYFEVQGTLITEGTAPTLSSVSPANGASEVKRDTALEATFSEIIEKGTGNIRIVDSGGAVVTQTIDIASSAVWVAGTRLLIAPTNILTHSATCYVEIDSGAVKDPYGNDFAGISGSGTWAFTIRDVPDYREDLNIGGGNGVVSDVGWTAVAADGSNLTDSVAIYKVNNYEGTHLLNSQYEMWVVTDCPSLRQVSEVRWLGGNNSRLGLEVNGVWYLSEQLAASTDGGFNPGDGIHDGVTITNFASGFYPWGAGDASTGSPANDTEAWDLSTLGAAGALPEGEVTRVGILHQGGYAKSDYYEVREGYVPPAATAVIIK